MKQIFIEKTKQAVQKWAEKYPNIELATVEVYPSSVPNIFHVIVVASKGFENWEQTQRENDLYWFLRKELGDSDIVKITVLLTLTEEQYEKYELTREEALV
ncbi:MAG: hypothetical protein ONB44_15955 [candidate division KSB1 bacterium]|nr:hypothetical protein [candidate division KSB1 bacterium]MDZ7303627.1 hypothetical protein [candidate division KSB1 bacterium]MDZ7312864.1 hypothetical protein [candidate division KSB1 bacterium]